METSTWAGRSRRRISAAELRLGNELRMLWEQHVWWTRMFIIAALANLADLGVTTQRVLKNPTDFAAALEPLYGHENAFRFARLFTEHLTIATELVQAVKVGDTASAAEAERRWYENAEQIARFLACINPFWSEDEWDTMLREHLSLTAEEAVSYVSRDYARSVRVFDRIERQALEMADVMTAGIVMQFPLRFR